MRSSTYPVPQLASVRLRSLVCETWVRGQMNGLRTSKTGHMLLDDNQLANLLTMNRLVDGATLQALQQAAHADGKSLYVTAVEKGAVAEEQLVTMMSTVLSVPSVSLAGFNAVEESLRYAPADFMQEHGILPLGVAPANGETTLFVATDNPTNTQPIAQLRASCRLPVKVLLAGPVDLAHALARVAESALEQPQPPIELAPPDMFDEMVLDEMYDQSQIDMMSALSMLDDIPADRHEADTPPSGLLAIDEMNDMMAGEENEEAESPFGTLGEQGLRGTVEEDPFILGNYIDDVEPEADGADELVIELEDDDEVIELTSPEETGGELPDFDVEGIIESVTRDDEGAYAPAPPPPTPTRKAAAQEQATRYVTSPDALQHTPKPAGNEAATKYIAQPDALKKPSHTPNKEMATRVVAGGQVEDLRAKLSAGAQAQPPASPGNEEKAPPKPPLGKLKLKAPSSEPTLARLKLTKKAVPRSPAPPVEQDNLLDEVGQGMKPPKRRAQTSSQYRLFGASVNDPKEQTGLGLPSVATGPGSGKIPRRQKAEDIESWKDAKPTVLVEALAQALIDAGVVREETLFEAVKKVLAAAEGEASKAPEADAR